MLNSVLALPDLVAEIDYTPEHASVGDVINVTMSVHNIGDANAYNVTVFKYDEYYCFSPTPQLINERPNITINSSINFTFNKTLRYGELELRLIADPYNEINETNDSNNNVSVIFNFPVTIATDKNTYPANELINIKITGENGNGFVYSTCENYKIYKYINSSWTHIRDNCEYPGSIPNCVPCVNDCPCWDDPQISLPDCDERSINYTWVWNESVTIGKYKAIFCYSSYCGGMLGFPCADTCVETPNFTIADSILTTNSKHTAVSPNTNFTIQINISGNNIYGAQFDLYFNSTVLEVIDVTEENFLKQNCTTYSILQVNNTIGKIKFADTCTGETGINGSGVLCNITFKAKYEGSSALNFDNVKVLDSELQQLYVAFTDGTVNVDSALPADVNNDHVVDIFDLATVGKAFGSICGDSKYDPKADINKDCEIDIFDIAFVGKNFGKSW